LLYEGNLSGVSGLPGVVSASQAYDEAAYQGWSTEQLRTVQQDLERAGSRSDIATAASAVVQRRER